MVETAFDIADILIRIDLALLHNSTVGHDKMRENVTASINILNIYLCGLLKSTDKLYDL